ncbi:MAG: hypothetical protein M0C28_29180 [Candidatus Moduliflexus flocculans]|nr:hypothetical protein [Candidatus Moduliflexus flocculans]
MEEVFERQTPNVKDFLLKTSILERVSASLCDAVTERVNSQRELEALEQANLFIIPLDQSRIWYRYHRLFAELLRQRLQVTDAISADGASPFWQVSGLRRRDFPRSDPSCAGWFGLGTGG